MRYQNAQASDVVAIVCPKCGNRGECVENRLGLEVCAADGVTFVESDVIDLSWQAQPEAEPEAEAAPAPAEPEAEAAPAPAEPEAES